MRISRDHREISNEQGPERLTERPWGISFRMVGVPGTLGRWRQAHPPLSPSADPSDDQSRLGATLISLRHSVRSIVSVHPMLYMPIARRRYAGVEGRIAGPGTELEIDGFERSGNWFAVAAFRSAQRRPVALVHHLHAPAQLIRAVRLGVLMMVLIRDRGCRDLTDDPDPGTQDSAGAHRMAPVTTAPCWDPSTRRGPPQLTECG